MSDVDVDGALARDLMRWTIIDGWWYADEGRRMFRVEDSPNFGRRFMPSTRIDDAFLLVDKIGGKFELRTNWTASGYEWVCSFGHYGDAGYTGEHCEETGPMAICRAALEVVKMWKV